MAPMLSNEMRQHIIVWYYEQHLSASDIHTLAGCSLHTVYNVLQDYGTVIHQPVLHHHRMLHFYFMNKFCNTQPTLLK